MNNRFINASDAEIEATGDRTCIICREDMHSGDAKKLSCNHIMHFHCLRMWLERSQSCPTCRREIPTSTQAQTNNNNHNVNNNNNVVHAQPPAQPRTLLQQLAVFFIPQRANQQPNNNNNNEVPVAAAVQPLNNQPDQLSLYDIARLHPVPPQSLQTSPSYHLPIPHITTQSPNDIKLLMPVIAATTSFIQSQLQYSQQQTQHLTDLLDKHIQYQIALQQYQQSNTATTHTPNTSSDTTSTTNATNTSDTAATNQANINDERKHNTGVAT